MKVYRNINEFEGAKNPVVTTGTFDGVHIGHQTILKRLQEIATKHRGETVLLTFHPHPRMVLFPDDHGLELLTTQEEKIRLLEKSGIDHLIIHPFTREFSRTTSIDFIKEILVTQIGTKKLVIGYDHHFGRNREGSFEALKESGPVYGFDVEEIPAQDVDNIAVSSTKIRKALEEGDLATANEYLGYEYMLSGTVIKGNQIGRSIDFPTANIEVGDSVKLTPANGVYAVRIELEGAVHKGMLNIGVRPTVDGTNRQIEANVFDFDRDIYGKEIVLHFVEKIRDEKKFDDLEALKKQLEIDRNKTKQILGY